MFKIQARVEGLDAVLKALAAADKKVRKKGVRKMAADTLAKFIEDTVVERPTLDELAKKLRDLFPEPKRPQLQV